MEKCPVCGAGEVEVDSRRTVYECGSSDRDQMPGTFYQSDRCQEPEHVRDKPDGFYLLSTADDSEVYLVRLYAVHGLRRVAFGPWDGTALMPVGDLRADSILTPARITVGDHPTRTLDLSPDCWVESARQFSTGMEYYQGLLDRCAAAIGHEAFVRDDGTVSPDPLRAKVPELVERLVAGKPQGDSQA